MGLHTGFLPPLKVWMVPLVYLATVELMPPQSPLSEVIGTVRFFSTSAAAAGRAQWFRC